jgi:hypothetical protein
LYLGSALAVSQSRLRASYLHAPVLLSGEPSDKVFTMYEHLNIADNHCRFLNALSKQFTRPISYYRRSRKYWMYGQLSTCFITLNTKAIWLFLVELLMTDANKIKFIQISQFIASGIDFLDFPRIPKI